MVPKGIYLKFPVVASTQVADQYVFLKSMYNDLRKDKEDVWMFYEPLADIMRVRQTSRQGDETICLATILSLEVDHYLAIPDTPGADAAKERMRIS